MKKGRIDYNPFRRGSQQRELPADHRKLELRRAHVSVAQGNPGRRLDVSFDQTGKNKVAEKRWPRKDGGNQMEGL